MAKITKDQAIAALERRKAQRESGMGWSGVANDVSNSLAGVIPAVADTITGFPGQIKESGKQIYNDPMRAVANIPVGFGEGAVGTANMIPNFAKYLIDKGVISKKNAGISSAVMQGGVMPGTIIPNLIKYLQGQDINEPIPNLGVEKAFGMDDTQPGDALLRLPGQFYSPGKIGSLIKGVSRFAKIGRAGASGAAFGLGQNQDPLQSAILTMMGEIAARGVSNIPGAVNRAAGVVPPETPPPGAMPPAGGAPSASMPSAMPAPMNAGFPVPEAAPAPIAPATATVAPAGIPWAANLPESVSWMQNIPQAALNVAAEVPKKAKAAAKKVPEVALKTLASALENGADFASDIPMVGKLASPIIKPVGGTLASYLKHISVPPEELAKRNLFGDIEQADIPGMEKMDEAAKRLGLKYATPSELMDSPFESVKQANVGRTTKGMKSLYKLGNEREGTEESAINKLFDLIHEDKLEPVKKAAYEQTMQNTVPDDFVVKQSSRPVIQKAMKAVDSNVAYKQMLQEEYGVDPENVAKNSFMYWDMVKRVLGDMESKLGRKGSNTEASVYGDTRRSMVDAMDLIEPQYKVARNIAERKFTKEELQNVFDKNKKTFNNFDSFLKSKENYNRIKGKLEAFPDALKQLEDIKLFSGNMIPNNPTIRAAAALKRAAMSDARNALEAKRRDF